MYSLGLLDTNSRKLFWNRLSNRIYWKHVEVCHIVKPWGGQRSSWNLEKLQPRTWKPLELPQPFALLRLCTNFILFHCTCTREGPTLLSETQKLLRKVLIGWPSDSGPIPDQSTMVKRVGSLRTWQLLGVCIGGSVAEEGSFLKEGVAAFRRMWRYWADTQWLLFPQVEIL